MYTVDSGQVTLASASQTPMLLVSTTTTAICDIQAIRVGAVSSSSAVFPGTATVQAYLARAANSPTGGTPVTPRPHNPADIPANTAWTVGSWTAAPTFGNILWGQVIPFTAGANWAEWVTPGAEWRIGPVSSTGAAAYAAVFLTCSSAGTATAFSIELVFSE
jgi:hypothetical protein